MRVEDGQGGRLEAGRRIAVLHHQLPAVQHDEGVVRPLNGEAMRGEHIEAGTQPMRPMAVDHVQIPARVGRDPAGPVGPAGQARGAREHLERDGVAALHPSMCSGMSLGAVVGRVIGDPITSRNEFEPGGEIEIKHVEEVFRRSAPILHLHVGGQVIRTTGEHPFFAYNKGWVKASTPRHWRSSALRLDGQWVAVEDILDTGEWEVVHNLCIADYHTYFVTDWDWGFAVWSHNTCWANILESRERRQCNPS